MTSSCLRFLDHTQQLTTLGRTPLDEWSARRRDLYPTTHNTHNRQISMQAVGFEPTIPASERPQIYALDRAATGTGVHFVYFLNMSEISTCWWPHGIETYWWVNNYCMNLYFDGLSVYFLFIFEHNEMYRFKKAIWRNFTKSRQRHTRVHVLTQVVHTSLFIEFSSFVMLFNLLAPELFF